MSRVEKVSVALTPEMAAMMREVVEAGEYASASEVMREALRDWQARRAQRERAVAELGRLWDEGLASGPARDGSEAFRALRAPRRQGCHGPASLNGLSPPSRRAGRPRGHRPPHRGQQPPRRSPLARPHRGPLRPPGRDARPRRPPPDVRPDLRLWPEGNCLILYRRAGPDVEIVRVLHGARQWQDLL